MPDLEGRKVAGWWNGAACQITVAWGRHLKRVASNVRSRVKSILLSADDVPQYACKFLIALEYTLQKNGRGPQIQYLPT